MHPSGRINQPHLSDDKNATTEFQCSRVSFILDDRINHFAVLDGQYPLVPFIQRDSYMLAFPPCV